MSDKYAILFYLLPLMKENFEKTPLHHTPILSKAFLNIDKAITAQTEFVQEASKTRRTGKSKAKAYLRKSSRF